MSKSRITGPLFKWFGSKWLSSKTIPQPKYDTIIEPFAGSAGYSLRHSDKRVMIYEINPHIYNLWGWLIKSATDTEIREIPLGILEGTDIRTIGLSPGQQLLLKNWQRTNNVGNCWTISPWGNKPGQWTENTRSRVADQVQHVKHWKIFNDCTELYHCDSFLECTWLVDPPYQYNYQYGCNPINYTELADLVYKLRGQVIVCEAVCSKTGAAPNWLPFIPFGERITSRRKEGCNTHSKELMYDHNHT